jgi:hypothetical protein
MLKMHGLYLDPELPLPSRSTHVAALQAPSLLE